MTSKPKKPQYGPGKRYPDSIRREAKRIYLTERAADREIAERVGVKSRYTIKEWRLKDEWAKDRETVAREADEMTVKKIADTEAEINARHIAQFRNLEALGNVYLASHVDPDSKKLKVPDAKDFRAMTAALRDIQQGLRLAMGLPDRIAETRQLAPTKDFSKMTDEELLAYLGQDQQDGGAPLQIRDAIDDPGNGTRRQVH